MRYELFLTDAENSHETGIEFSTEDDAVDGLIAENYIGNPLFDDWEGGGIEAIDKETGRSVYSEVIELKN